MPSPANGASILRVLRHDDADYSAVLLQDPEGNEFCISGAPRPPSA